MRPIFSKAARILALMAVLLSLVGAGRATAQARPRTGDHTRELEMRHARILERHLSNQFAEQLDARAQAAQQQAAAGANAAPSSTINSEWIWTKMVFESYRAGHWDIWTTNGGKNNLLQLTNTSAADSGPRYNVGANRIVFSSKQDGDWEIFSMNANGSGLRQLTFNGSIDSDPAWSPDGTKIAFSSTRTGDYEVFIMNADGSGQTNLTNHPGYFDASPYFSPDGYDIAYASEKEDGNSYLRRMAVNGSGKQDLMGPVAYLDYPVYSPNGINIMSSVGYDGNLWYIVVDYNLDTGQQQRESCGTADCIPNSYTPHGFHYLYTKFQYEYNLGDHRWELVYIDMISDLEYGTAPIYGLGLDIFPDMENADFTPPVTSIITPLEAWTSSSQMIEMQGVDSGCGFCGYLAQYQLDGSTDWIDFTGWEPYEEGTYINKYINISSLPQGQPLSIRLVGRDCMGNVAPSPSRHTMIYETMLSGRVTDLRGHPVYQATITNPVPAFYSVNPSDLEGRYAFYYLSGATLSGNMSVSASGFGTLLPVSLTSRMNWALPPEQIDFAEQGESGLDGWSVESTGCYNQQVSSTDYHTGTKALTLDQYNIGNGFMSLSISNTTPVAIRADANLPTLSFWVKFDGITPQDHVFWVEVNGVQVFRLLDNHSEWHHYWVDLSPWKGQAITLKFSNSGIASQYSNVYIFLDEIFIAETNNPQVDIVAPDTIQVGQGDYTLEIGGANFKPGARVFVGNTELSVTSVSSDHITAILSSQLNPGTYTLRVLNPDGMTAVYASPFTAQGLFFLPHVQR